MYELRHELSYNDTNQHWFLSTICSCYRTVRYVFPNSFVFPYFNLNIFCDLFICLEFDGLLESICFRMFCSKHSITFDTYLLSCRFHCVDIFYIKVRSCETLTITNSGAILLLIETLSKSRTIKCWFILYLQMYILG